MVRRSKRLLQEKMSADKGDLSEASSENECDDTILENKDTSVAELREEIQILKKQLWDIANTPRDSPPTNSQLPASKVPTIASGSTDMTSCIDANTPGRNSTMPNPQLHSTTDTLQVTIERAFSALKIVLTEYRNRLSEETLENILLVKLNPTFIDAAIENCSLFEEDVQN